MSPKRARASRAYGTSLAASRGAQVTRAPAIASSTTASACTWPVMTAAISATGRSSRPQPRARMCPRRPAGLGLAFLISRTSANAMLPSSSSDTRYAKLIAAGSSRSRCFLSWRVRRGRAMGLRPGSVVGLSPLSGEAGQPAQGLGQHLGLLAEGEADVAAGRFGVVVEDGGRDGDHAGAVGQGPAELHAVLVAQRPDVGGNEVGALRLI